MFASLFFDDSKRFFVPKNRRRIIRAKVATDFASAGLACARKKKKTNGVVAVGGNSFTTTTKTFTTTLYDLVELLRDEERFR